MVSEPVGEFVAIEPASGKIEHKALLGIDGGIDLGAVEYQERLHGGMPDALVAIDKGVALNQRHTQRRGLLRESGVQLITTERGLGLGDCRLQRTEVPNAGRPTGRLEEAAVAELRSAAAVVLTPSRSEEAFPYAALDALAAGVS